MQYRAFSLDTMDRVESHRSCCTCSVPGAPSVRGSVRKGGIRRCSPAVSFASMSDGSDLDCVLVPKVEENPVIATAEPEAVGGGLQRATTNAPHEFH